VIAKIIRTITLILLNAFLLAINKPNERRNIKTLIINTVRKIEPIVSI